MTAPSSLPPLRTGSLAFDFQDVITVVLRVRYRTQRVSDAAGFRNSIRQMIATAAQQVRKSGYSDQASQQALYAIVGFLDESVLNSQDPTFADWSRRPLQEEMFGGHFAGEYFFRHVGELLQQPDTSEVADVLELHEVCLLLGYRGKYAFSDPGEIQNILRSIRQKILRIRGNPALFRVGAPPAEIAAARRDPWIRRLMIITAGVAFVLVIAFLGYWLLLGSGLSHVTTSALTPGIQQFQQAAAPSIAKSSSGVAL
jgi:type VI secretion system protein ImpK